MSPTGWRWWCFVGVAHETTRMVYEPPLARLAAQYLAMARAIGEALAPMLRFVASVVTEVMRSMEEQGAEP